MALIYMDREEALDEFGAELLPRMKDSTELRDLYSADETKKYVTEAVTWAVMKGSNTALELFAFVSASSHKIAVVGMKGGFQCFGTAEGKLKRPVIFVDLDGMLKYKTRLSKSEHDLRFPPWLRSSQSNWLRNIHYKDHAKDSDHVAVTKFVGKETELSNRIATLHELGHAKQWIEKPDMFPKADPVNPEGVIPRPLTGIREQIRQAAETRAGKSAAGTAHILKASEMPALFTAWDAVVEMDNMSRHEWPICQELGIGYRKNYCDLGGKTGGHGAQLNELLRRKIEAKEKEDREKELAKTAAKASDFGASENQVWWCPLERKEIKGKTKIGGHMRTCRSPVCKAGLTQ